MPREYRHIKQYENEILQLKSERLTYQQIGERLGLERIKVKRFLKDDILERKTCFGYGNKAKRQVTKGRNRIFAISTTIK